MQQSFEQSFDVYYSLTFMSQLFLQHSQSENQYASQMNIAQGEHRKSVNRLFEFKHTTSRTIIRMQYSIHERRCSTSESSIHRVH
jgi:hypothetical protein